MGSSGLSEEAENAEAPGSPVDGPRLEQGRGAGGVWGAAGRWGCWGRSLGELSPERRGREAGSRSREQRLPPGNVFDTRTHETFVCSPSRLATITGVGGNKATLVKRTFLFQKFLLVKAAELTAALTSQ